MCRKMLTKELWDEHGLYSVIVDSPEDLESNVTDSLKLFYCHRHNDTTWFELWNLLLSPLLQSNFFQQACDCQTVSPYYRLISAAACVQVCGDKRSWKSTQEWCWKLTTADKTVTLIMQVLPDVTQQHELQKALIKHNSWTITFRAHQRCWYTFQKLWLSSAPKQFEGQITNTFSRPNLHKYQVGTRNVFPLGHVSFSFVRWCYLLKPKNTNCSLFECIFFYTWFLSWCPIHYNRRLVWTTEGCWSQMCLDSMNSILVLDLIDVFLFLETVSRRHFYILYILYII